ncbi:MAG: hypothetical protein AAF587_31125 [Bacteroidota bacterium]
MMRPHSLYHFLWIWILVVAGQQIACLQAETTTTNAPPEHVQESGFRQLSRAYRESGKLLLVYGADDSLSMQAYASICQQLANESSRIRVKLWRADLLPEDSLIGCPLMLLGTPTGNPWIKRFEDKLPLELTEGGFSFHHQTYESEADVFHLSFYPHPLQDSLPLGIVTGTNDQAILAHLNTLPGSRRSRWGNLWPRWGFQVFQKGKRLVMGAFEDDWSIGEKQYWNFAQGETPLATTEHFQIYDHRANLTRSECARLEERLERGYTTVQEFLGGDEAELVIQYHAYGSSELMGLMKNQQTQGYVELAKGEAHVIESKVYANNIVEPQNHLMLRHRLGTPQLMVLETGLCNLLTEKWQKYGALYWAARLAESNDALPLEELCANQPPEGSSYLVRGAMAAAFVQFLIDSWGKEKFLEHYQNWSPSAKELKRMESDWHNYLTNLTATFPQKRRTSEKVSYYRGMTFAHEGYNIHNGYGSTMGQESLEKIASLNANSIAIVPYSGTREVYKPVPFRLNQWAGGENDAAVVASFHMARDLGMQTLLKPQIWFPGAWPGEVEMKSEADWKAFFQHYRRWIRHYALLAEIHEMDMFCVGVEFAKATIQHPEAWRRLIQDMRHLYQGPITYAANWGEEFEKLAFGDELDVIGVDNYYPLSKRDSPSDKVLEDGFNEVKKTLKKVYQRYKKPIIFTEVGFRSIEAPWKQPHEEANGAKFSAEDQARCYRVILEGIQGEEWCKGMFWWKWPSYMDYGSRRSRSFSPCGKEAQHILKTAYAKLK